VQARLEAMIDEARAARTEALALRSGKARQAAASAMGTDGGAPTEEECEQEGSDATPLGDAFSRMSVMVRRCGHGLSFGRVM